MNKINIPENVTKFLVSTNEPRVLGWLFGMQGIYIDKIKSIGKDNGSVNSRPTIVTAKYDVDLQLKDAELSLQYSLNAKRIFKSETVNIKRKDKINGFIFACAKSLCNMAKGRTIKVACKNNKKLQQQFYDALVKVNNELKTKCLFDYDKYNVAFVVREYSTNTKYTIVTLVEGI